MIEALECLKAGGRLVVDAIRRLTDDRAELLRLDYATHLWMEREVKSVANVTRADVREVLSAAVEMGLRPTVEELPSSVQNDALDALRRERPCVVHACSVLRLARTHSNEKGGYSSCSRSR